MMVVVSLNDQVTLVSYDELILLNIGRKTVLSV